MSAAQSAEQLAAAHRSVGNGPPDVLFVHGWAGSGAYFEETIAALDLEHVRAITLDLLGHGDSPLDTGEWTLDGIDGSILHVLDAIGARRPVLVGYSMGGKFVQHFAVRHPDRVSGLVLVAGTEAAAFALPQEVLTEWYACAGDADAFGAIERMFLTGPVDETVFHRAGTESARASLSALQGTMRATLEEDFSQELASIDVPTLVIAGEKDELFTTERLRATIVSQIAGARMIAVDCGHCIPLERPRELAALIEAFLAGARLDG